MRTPIALTVNGVRHEVLLKGSETLLDVLRLHLNVTSPKRGCDTGDCGACAVIVDGKLVNSCLALAFTCRDKQVLTVEGLGSPTSLHPIQRIYHELYAAQCGFCTPGMIMATKALLDRNPSPTREEAADYLAGNLCRCTGYVKILDAVMRAAQELLTAGAPAR